MYNKLTINGRENGTAIGSGLSSRRRSTRLEECSGIRNDKIVHGFGVPWESTQNEVDFE